MNTQRKFAGAFTAIVTPFRGGKVAFDDLAALVEKQIAAGIDGIIPAGTTGESPTLSMKEHVDVVRCVVEAAAGRVPVIAGAGANNTEEAIHLTKEADAAGADAFLHVTPYYNKPSQEGLFRHYGAVAAVTEKPIVLYSIPGRSVIEIGIETLLRLVDAFPNITAIKESGGRVFRASQMIDALGDRITILSGEDEHTLPYMSLGAVGVISVASNVAPAQVTKLVHAALGDDLATARAENRRLYPLFRDLFCETSPAPVKYALVRAGLISSDEVRLPLVELSEAGRRTVDAALSRVGL